MAQISSNVVMPVEWTLISLSLSIIVVRLGIRIFYHQKRPNLSDIFVVAGWIIAVSGAACDTITHRLGGMNLANYPSFTDEQHIYMLKLAYADDMFNDVGFYFAKFSMLALYYELISVAFGTLCLSLKIIIVYVIIAFGLTWGFDTFWCLPISSNWSLNPSSCVIFSQPNISYINWSLNMSSDIAIFVLPFFLLHHLRFSNKQFIGIVATFSLGAVTMLCSVARFVVLQLDVLTDYTPIYILYAMELNISLIVVSLPILKPFVRNKKKQQDSSSARTFENPSISYDIKE